MHYPPPHHQESNFENIIALMQTYPLATIITAKNEDILSSHTPLIYQANNELGRLIGHLDKYNPQLDHFRSNEKVELIFNGPQVYISPSVYGTTQLPTWNYFKAHLKGRIKIENDQEKVKQSLINMTAFLEGENPAYTLESNNPRMAAALDYIVGFHIEIDSWEGKYKISQDKRKDDQLRAKKAMQEAEKMTEKAIELLYSLHKTKREA
ncbi:MAG: FMN-binding negative transcriptional regulator [Flavobacteriaceae bacterium]